MNDSIHHSILSLWLCDGTTFETKELRNERIVCELTTDPFISNEVNRFPDNKIRMIKGSFVDDPPLATKHLPLNAIHQHVSEYPTTFKYSETTHICSQSDMDTSRRYMLEDHNLLLPLFLSWPLVLFKITYDNIITVFLFCDNNLFLMTVNLQKFDFSLYL